MKFIIYNLFFCIWFSGTVIGATPILLTQDSDSWQMRGEQVDYMQDFEERFSIYDVTSDKFKNRFLSDKNEDIVTFNRAVTYWARVSVINVCSTNKHWILELFEPKIEHLEIYIINSEGQLTLYRGGAEHDFGKKVYYHKNYIYDLPIKSGEQIEIYLKIKVKRRGVMLGVIRTVQSLVGFASSEYFVLALFYGIIIAIIFSNIFLFLFLSDKAYLYYVFYIIGIGAYALSLDGLGFQYIWPNHPEWNEYIFPIATYCMIASALLYARRFFNLNDHTSSLINKGIYAILVMRTFIFSLWFLHPGFGFLSWIDLIPLLYLYLTGFYFWFKGMRQARFYVIAFTLFFAGFLLSILQYFHLIKANIFTEYSFKMGVLGEIIMLSLALADRVKVLTHDMQEAQKETILQLLDKEQIIEKSNRDLEKKVLERTLALEEKNKEMDTFVYRSSHDIKGPLKSIIGATSLALIEVDNDLAVNYFNHILKSSQQLDNVVDHLLSVIEIKEKCLEIGSIDINQLINATLESYQLLYETQLQIEVYINQQWDFFSDSDVLKSIMHNLVRTALKYRNPDNKHSFLRIDGETDHSGAWLIFTDNGTGIDKKILEKVFDIFNKSNLETSVNGFNLYMTKIYVEKLGGIMQVESHPGNGSKFTLNFKNHVTPFIN